eukprot:592649-Pelagomonas_calceolata.AAC.1
MKCAYGKVSLPRYCPPPDHSSEDSFIFPACNTPFACRTSYPQSCSGALSVNQTTVAFLGAPATLALHWLVAVQHLLPGAPFTCSAAFPRNHADALAGCVSDCSILPTCIDVLAASTYLAQLGRLPWAMFVALAMSFVFGAFSYTCIDVLAAFTEY